MTTTRTNAKDTGESPPLEFRVLGLKPCSRPATHIPRANALRDDCFEVHPARMTKRPPSPVIRSASDSSRPLNASCAVPEAQGARPACPPPPPKNPLNADSGLETAPVVLERRQWPMEPDASLQQESVRVSRVWLYALPLGTFSNASSCRLIERAWGAAEDCSFLCWAILSLGSSGSIG